MKLNDDLLEIFSRFESVGSRAYLVGGCVRDAVMGRLPHDYDLTTPLLPQEIEALFSDKKLFTVGKKFGTIGVVLSQGTYEITTFRVDGSYEDHRRPTEVAFTPNLREDLARRDFTINAMAYHPEEGLVDPFGGRRDIERAVITTVGDPHRRFSEDALRILRALRFMGQLNFELEEQTRRAMEEDRAVLRGLSRERVRDELDRILLQERPSRVLTEMAELHILEEVLPSLVATVDFDQMTPYHDKTLFWHIACVVDHVPAKLPLRYAALFHDVAKPQTLSVDPETGRGHFFGHDTEGAAVAGEALKLLRHAKDFTREVQLYIEEHMKVAPVMTDKALRRQIRRVGEEHILDLYALLKADMACTREDRDISLLEERERRIVALMREDAHRPKKLAISGRDLLDMGYRQGPEMGRVLAKLQDIATGEPEKNTREHLTALALQWKGL
ncbi:MAG: CCA tRNA nucleotidyltransferase [Tissierellia bacterium]|nr:CCA tRNA nucleotidyltransferase [Tissierellia bacterium]